jgi:hypothetical protein
MQRPILILAALALMTTALQADVLLVKRSSEAQGGAYPKRGASKAQIAAQYGAPSTKHAPVGKPPITRWDYPAFSVYFEHDHVIDSVLKKGSESEMGVKPVVQPKQ